LIDVGAVSRYHCKITVENDVCAIEDLNSRNGTFVNDVVTEGRHVLEHGARVRVCDVVFAFFQHEEESSTDDSGSRAVMVDDDSSDTGSSTIMSKLDVRSGVTGPMLATSPDVKLRILITITQSLSKRVSLDSVLPQVLESLFQIFVQADRGFIGLINDQGVLVPRWTKLRREDSDETIRISRTIASQVMDAKEAILSADAASDARFETSESIADFRIRSMMCVPLLDNDGNAFGMLQIDTLDQRQRFTDEDLELLVSAAGQAAIAIDNARLHEEQLRQRGLERDLELARDVQKAFLPNRPPDVDGYEFFSYYNAANQIGGDYYDYIWLPNGRLAVIVADVVGHGVAAAMLMAKLSAEARYCLASESHPATATTLLNRRLCQLNLDRFVTFVMVVIDPQTHAATIVNAGHMSPEYLRSNGELEETGKADSGLPLGIADMIEYQQTEISLAPGESMTLYTDGISEAANAARKQYTIPRIREMILASDGSPSDIGKSIVADVRDHLGDCMQDDDMCLVVLRRSPSN